MINKIFFLIGESLRSVIRTKVHTIVSSLAIAVSLIIISVTYFLFELWTNYKSTLTSQYKIEVYLTPEISNENAQDLFHQIWSIEGLENGDITYQDGISNEIKEFGGDDIEYSIEEIELDLINHYGYKPFPIRLRFSVLEKFRNQLGIEKIIAEINAVGGPENFIDYKNNIWDEGEQYFDSLEDGGNNNGEYDENEDFIDGNGIWDSGESYTDSNNNGKYDLSSIDEIIYDFQSSEMLYKRISNIFAFIIMFIIIISIVSIFYVSNTILLVIYSRKSDMDILKLLGASNNFIKFPYMLEGIIFGLLGGIISMLFLFFTYYLIAYLSDSIVIQLNNYNLIIFVLLNVLVGPFLGFLGSSRALSAYIKNR